MYRTNTLPKSTVRLAARDPLTIFNIAALASTNPLDLDVNDYHRWIDSWKATYAILSADISSTKRFGENHPRTQQHLQDMKLMANTMLNARQNAKDKRRAFFAHMAGRNAPKESTPIKHDQMYA